MHFSWQGIFVFWTQNTNCVDYMELISWQHLWTDFILNGIPFNSNVLYTYSLHGEGIFLLQGNNLYSETIPMHGSHALMWSSIKKNITAYIWNSFQNRIYRQKRLDCHNAEFWKRAYIMTHVPYCAMAAPPITWRYLFSITTWPRQDLKLLLTF